MVNCVYDVLSLCRIAVGYFFFPVRAVCPTASLSITARVHMRWNSIVRLRMGNRGCCMIHHWLCYPGVVGVQDWLMDYWRRLVEYYWWLMVDYCWPVNNNRRLMVNYGRSM